MRAILIVNFDDYGFIFLGFTCQFAEMGQGLMAFRTGLADHYT